MHLHITHTHYFEKKRVKFLCEIGPRDTWPKGFKTFFMFNSAEQEIETSHKY